MKRSTKGLNVSLTSIDSNEDLDELKNEGGRVLETSFVFKILPPKQLL